jgi:uncharacterized membrane protein
MEEVKSTGFLKNKHIVVIILLGVLTTFIGALGKINSEPWGGLSLTIGIITQLIGISLGVLKLFTSQKFKDMLNS